jgi:hypothetical protein
MMDIQRTKASASRMFREHKGLSKGPVGETTPIEISVAIAEFCATLSSEPVRFIPVVDDVLGMYGWCNIGVAERVKESGGHPVFGWAIWDWRQLFLTAEFHTVWESPTEKLLDITPKPDGEKQIAFVPDNSFAPDFDFLKRPGSKRRSIYKRQDSSKIIQDKIAAISPKKIAYESKRAARHGLTLDQWLASKLHIDELAVAIERFIKIFREQEEYKDRQGGSSGLVRMDEKLSELFAARRTAHDMLVRLATSKSFHPQD